ncbi:MAG: hypothetical protein JWL59_3428 [Chthoniobacteraceae bacterium]|nr:hypothetical protein [Chthoniobacteraceae bacterium]
MHSIKWLRLLALIAALSSTRADEHSFNYFNDLSGDAWVSANAGEVQKHFDRWKAARGQERQSEAAAVKFYAWRGERLEVIAEVIADGRLAETRVKVPAKAKTVTVEPRREIKKGPNGTGHIVWRRITPSRFEVWNSARGYLFDAKGNLVHSAKPPRKDGYGREWLGAFLPDGHWITTELLESDGRVYIFDAKEHCTREIKAGNLLEEGATHGKPLLVPWARSTKDGDEWLVRIGSEEGLGEVLLKADGTSRPAKAPPSLWQRCMARQLGIRLTGGITGYTNESDDGAVQMHSQQPGHGNGVGNPEYELVSATDTVALGNIPSDGRIFGFWPHSHACHVFNDQFTWFFDASGKYQGWVEGQRVGDAADGKLMIFRQTDGACITVSPDLHALGRQRFVLPNGHQLYPLELHPDIGLGVFVTKAPGEHDELTDNLLGSRKVIIGRWKAAQ